jgi:hypothetical protein
MEPLRHSGQVYLSTGAPETSVETTQFRNELGQIYNDHRGRWRKVLLESATTEAIAAKKPIYYKDKASWTVTFDLTDSQGEGNAPAGVIPTLVNGETITATLPAVGQYFWLLEEAFDCTMAGTNANFAAKGGWVTSAAVGVVTYTAPGTAAPRAKFGTVHTAVDRSGGAGDVRVNLKVETPA